MRNNRRRFRRLLGVLGCGEEGRKVGKARCVAVEEDYYILEGKWSAEARMLW